MKSHSEGPTPGEASNETFKWTVGMEHAEKYYLESPYVPLQISSIKWTYTWKELPTYWQEYFREFELEQPQQVNFGIWFEVGDRADTEKVTVRCELGKLSAGIQSDWNGQYHELEVFIDKKGKSNDEAFRMRKETLNTLVDRVQGLTLKYENGVRKMLVNIGGVNVPINFN